MTSLDATPRTSGTTPASAASHAGTASHAGGAASAAGVSSSRTSSCSPSYAARYRARLVRALEPFALVACAWLGVAGRARRAVRERNRMVALKLAVLGDPVAKAELRRKLGGHGALWAWEMRAQARVREMHGRLKRAVRAGVGTEKRKAVAETLAEDWGELDALLAEAFAIDAAMDAGTDGTAPDGAIVDIGQAAEADRTAMGADAGEAAGGGTADSKAADTETEDMQPPRGARPIRFALPSLPRVDVGDGGPNYLGWTSGRRPGVSERRRRARVVRVWPSELMSEAENAGLAQVRALRRKKLADRCAGCGTEWSPRGVTPPWAMARARARADERERVWARERAAKRERERARYGPDGAVAGWPAGPR